MTSGSFNSNDVFFHSLDPNSSKDGATETYGDEVYTNDEELENEEDLEFLKNTYFRVGHDGCDEYTELTTFHGMIRVFNSSKNWPSLIFWCLVVTTCLVFYMIVCGSMIKTYASQPSFIRTNKTKYERKADYIELCSKIRLKCSDVLNEKKILCKNTDDRCISLSFSKKVEIELQETDLYLKLGSEPQTFHMISANNTHHRFRLKVIQKNRLDLERSVCYDSWTDVKWMKYKKIKRDDEYSFHKCELLRWNFTKPQYLQTDYPCQPACYEISYQIKYFKTWKKSTHTKLTIDIDPISIQIDETRKTTIVDILCFLGGASSLFMGCSCVTLMEMLIFLVKLISSSILSKEAPELEEDLIAEKFAFEYSDHRNKRRFAVFDRETLEKYNLLKIVEDNRSIVLDRKSSVFSGANIKKAPPLQKLRETRNFQNMDIFDIGNKSVSIKEDSFNTSKKDDFSIDLQDEKRDTVGETIAPDVRIRPPLRRESTTTSHASHTSRSSTSTSRTYYISHPVRENRRIFTRNLPMNDF